METASAEICVGCWELLENANNSGGDGFQGCIFSEACLESVSRPH